MRTYVTVYVSTEGAPASEIVEKFRELGFEPTLGQHDFVYDWKKKDVSPMEVINFVDRVQSKLKGCDAMLHFATVK